MHSISTARIHTIARAIVYPDKRDKLVNVIDLLSEKQIPYLVVGGMSNLLIKSQVYNGVIIKTTKLRTKNVAENIINVECGVRINEVIMQTAPMNLGGMEGLCSIPGTVGGMVKQNAGAYGYEISDCFLEALCYLPRECAFRRFSKEDMGFAYRESALSDKDIILINATFELLERPQNEIVSRIKELRAKRSEAQPTQYPSLGSVFKRCNGIGAGYYIDRCGLKGYSVGGASVSEKHAGFIVNTGGATAKDYLEVIEYVKNKVYAEFGIELEEEIEII